jgi:hypothetical protein
MNRTTLLFVTLASITSVAVGCGDDTTATGGSGGGNGGEAQGGQAQGGDGVGGATGGGNEGGGTSAATCAAYCGTIQDGCVDTNAQYADEASCLEECAAFDQGEPAAMSGNSLECRAYHASVAAGGTDPSIHCVHAGPLGGGPTAMAGCGTTRCEAFCQIAQEICGTDANYPFDNEDDCNTECAAYADTDDFNMMETSGDTLACRMYHLSVAPSDASHCAHLSGSLCN